MPLPDEVFAFGDTPAVPGGNFAKPLIIALLALLAARKFGAGRDEKPDISPPETKQTTQPTAQGAPVEESPETISDGLRELTDQFRKTGLGKAIDTWINPGANRSVESKEVSDALGGDLVDELTRRTGLSRDQVLDGLAKVLPGVVDKLTPEGRLPTQQDLFRFMS